MANYPGPVQVAEDLMVIEVGETIDVHGPSHGINPANAHPAPLVGRRQGRYHSAWQRIMTRRGWSTPCLSAGKLSTAICTAGTCPRHYFSECTGTATRPHRRGATPPST